MKSLTPQLSTITAAMRDEIINLRTAVRRRDTVLQCVARAAGRVGPVPISALPAIVGGLYTANRRLKLDKQKLQKDGDTLKEALQIAVEANLLPPGASADALPSILTGLVKKVRLQAERLQADEVTPASPERETVYTMTLSVEGLDDALAKLISEPKGRSTGMPMEMGAPYGELGKLDDPYAKFAEDLVLNRYHGALKQLANAGVSFAGRDELRLEPDQPKVKPKFKKTVLLQLVKDLYLLCTSGLQNPETVSEIADKFVVEAGLPLDVVQGNGHGPK